MEDNRSFNQLKKIVKLLEGMKKSLSSIESWYVATLGLKVYNVPPEVLSVAVVG